jgi:hypothetical protein
METRHVTTDELQLATHLCRATINAIIQRFKDEKGLCTLNSKGSHTCTKGEKG